MDPRTGSKGWTSQCHPRSSSHAQDIPEGRSWFPTGFPAQLDATFPGKAPLFCVLGDSGPRDGAQSFPNIPVSPPSHSQKSQKGRTGVYFGIFLLLPEHSTAPSSAGSQIPKGIKGQGRDHSPKFPLLVSAPGFQKAWERHIFHGFVQAPFEPVPCCRFFIPTAHPHFPKIAQFPARPTAWDGISVPNSSLLSPLDSASGGIADGFRAELPEPLSATGRAFSIKENSLQRPEIKKAQILSRAI